MWSKAAAFIQAINNLKLCTFVVFQYSLTSELKFKKV